MGTKGFEHSLISAARLAEKLNRALEDGDVKEERRLMWTH